MHQSTNGQTDGVTSRGGREEASDFPVTMRIVRDIRAGDKERFAELYERIGPAIYAWAQLRIPESLRPLVSPNDVMQEVWCRALLAFPRFDPERATFRAWMFGFAHKVLMEAFRHVNRRAVDPNASLFEADRIPAEATSVSQRVSKAQVLRRFLRLVDKLDEDEQELLVLRGLEQLPHGAVASQLGMSAELVRKRWQRLRDKIVELSPAGEFVVP